MSIGSSSWNSSTNQIDITIPPADENQKTAGYATVTTTFTDATAQKKVVSSNPSQTCNSGTNSGGCTLRINGSLFGGATVNSTQTEYNKNSSGAWVQATSCTPTPNGNTTTYVFTNSIVSNGGQTSIVITMTESGGGL